jgi:hypothetical protein
VLNILNEARSQGSGQLFAHGPTLFLVKVSHALLDRLRTRLDVEGVLDDFLRDAWHFYWAPRKHVLVASEEADELTFLFGVYIGLDLHSFGRVFGIDLNGLSVLVCLENARCWRHGQDERFHGCLEADLPQLGRGDRSSGQLNAVLLAV